LWRDDSGLHRAVVDAGIKEAIAALVDGDLPGMVASVISGPSAGAKAVLDGGGAILAGNLPEELAAPVGADSKVLMRVERSVTLGYGADEVFFESIAPRPHLFVFGAVHIAQELVTHASLLGYRTVVADPRPAFVTAERFPDADELRIGWPDDVCDADELDARSFLVVLSHDRRFEDPLWPIALGSSARYIGAMGSAKTTARRRERLLGDGFSPAQIERIHGPIGLDIGSRTAGETAIAILAEMTSVRYASSEAPDLMGSPLRP